MILEVSLSKNKNAGAVIAIVGQEEKVAAICNRKRVDVFAI